MQLSRFLVLCLTVALAAAWPGARAANGSTARHTVGPDTNQAPALGDSALLYRTYRDSSPHWPHIRTMVTDFRTLYLKPPAQGRERAWNAAHFDYVMSGDAAAYRRLNPGIRALPYALLWTVYVPGGKDAAKLTSGSYADLADWFGRHPGDTLENALLHKPGGDRTAANRVVIQIWDKQNRYALNPGNPAVRAYEADRMTRIAAGLDGVFLDEFGAGGIHGHLEPGALEYPELKGYDEDLTRLLADAKKALGPKILMINTAAYRNPPDREMILAAGAAHLEGMNNPISGDMEGRWTFLDDLLGHGALLELVSQNSWGEVNSRRSVFATYSPGSYSSSAARWKVFELASYYMVVPRSPDRLLLDMSNSWSVPFSDVWLRAEEADIGHPLGARAVMAQGKDPTGHDYRVWARSFDRALVLIRPVVGWDTQRFDDSTVVTVPIPRGQSLRPLQDDGTLGSPVTQVTLRNSEAAILVKDSANY